MYYLTYTLDGAYGETDALWGTRQEASKYKSILEEDGYTNVKVIKRS